MAQYLQDMCLTFTLPGYDALPLMKGGKETAVTKANVRQYVDLVAHYRLVYGESRLELGTYSSRGERATDCATFAGVRREMQAVRSALHTAVTPDYLRWFTALELDELLCGSASDKHWKMDTLRQCIKPDHGYHHASLPVQWLVEVRSFEKKTIYFHL